MKLNYKLEGKGKTLVFIHGLSDNLLYWQPLINNLKDHYQILRYDLRGHGFSELGDEKITMDTYVDDLLSLLDKLEITEANLIGFSLGSAIALAFSIKYPDKVTSMTLISSFFKSDEQLTKVFNSFKNSLEKGFIEFFDTILPMVLCPNAINANREELNLIRDESSKTANVDAYIVAVDVCLNFNVEDKLHHIDIPTLMIAGKYDEVTLLSSQNELHSKLKNSKLFVLKI